MQLGWIDFSKEDRQKALDVINLLSEQGAVDELGIGIIRDAFANYFFPGTSTIQTRAKYFLIVPYMLREAVDGRYGKDANRVLRAIDSAEKDCGTESHRTAFPYKDRTRFYLSGDRKSTRLNSSHYQQSRMPSSA